MKYTTHPLIEVAVRRIVLEYPWLTELCFDRADSFVENNTITASNGQGTMATDGVTVFYHPDVVKWPIKKLQGVCVHEWLHGALDHPKRLKGIPKKYRKYMNMAADDPINKMVIEWGLELPEGHVDLPWTTPEMTVPEIYARLIENLPEEEGEDEEGEPGEGGDEGGEGDGEGKDEEGEDEGAGGGKPEEKPGKGKKPGRSGSGTPKPTLEPGDLRPPPAEVGPPDKAKEEDDANRKQAQLARIAAAAKQAGKLPAGLGMLVNDWLKPKVSWREKLASLSTQVTSQGWSYLKTNDSYRAVGAYVPGRRSRSLGDIVVVRDTSGSLCCKQGEVLAEVRGIIEQANPSRIILIDCDASVHRVMELEPTDAMPTDALGGGGTDFRPVFKLVEEKYPDTTSMVFITDLYGTFPENQPPYLVVWATIESGGQKPPFGEHVVIED